MQKFTPYFQLYLRLALGISFFVFGLDRLGAWGKYGEHGISWGDWQHFMVYAKDVMQFLPASVATVFAVIATIAEITFGALLVLGLFTRIAAIGGGLLTLLFGTSMAISHGIMEPLSYSVFTASAGGFLLATVNEYRWGIDDWFRKKRE